MAMRPPWVVRPSEPGDSPAILALAENLKKWFTPQAHQTIGRELSTHGGYVAVRDARVLGFLMWTPSQEAGVARLSWIGVAEVERHLGIGTSLLAALVASLKANGFRYLDVDTVADNVDYEPYAETRRFYRACGFVGYRVDPKHYGEGEERYDRLVLRLDLTRGPHAPRGPSTQP